MNDLRSPLEDRPYRPATRSLQDDRVISTPQYYRSKLDALRQSRFFPLLSVDAAVIIFGGIISYAYKQGSQTGPNATTPIVQASNTDYKEKPANPGGMDVPFQDAVVFDQLGGNKDQKTASAQTVESLLPDAEKPVDKTASASTATDATKTADATTTNATTPADAAAKTETLNTAAASTETLPETSTTTAQTTAPAAATATQQASTDTSTVKSENLTTASTTATTKSTNEIAKKMDAVAPASAPATTKIQSGNYKIQLGAFHDEAAAKAAWGKFQKEFSSQLSKVTPAYAKADLGAKGTFYRVQGINLSKATADELCRSINSAKSGSCIVAR